MIIFFVSIYNETKELAEQCIDSIRQFYPSSKVFGITDGVSRPELALLFDEYIEGERLKLINHGGKWTYRFLSKYLEDYSNYEYLFKIDLDTLMTSKLDLSKLPKTGVFGSIHTVYTSNSCWKYIQGGCIGFTKASAQAIIDSGLLFNRKYCNSSYAYQRYNSGHVRGNEAKSNETFSVEDKILYEIVCELNLTITEMSDFSCYAYFHKQFVDINKPIIHPNIKYFK